MSKRMAAESIRFLLVFGAYSEFVMSRCVRHLCDRELSRKQR